MQLRLIATSDVHIGNYGTAVDENGMNLGFLSNRRCREFMLDYARKVKPDVGIFVGDLYKSAVGRPTQTEQMEAAKFFRDWSLISPLYLKPGNHDVGEFTSEGFGVHALEVFGHMNLRLIVLPKEDWSVLDLAGVRVGLYHGMLAGVRLESGLMSDSVRENLPALKDAPAADFYLLGDIHHRQFLAPNAAYCGALDRLNFGEEDETPTFWDLLIERDDNTGQVAIKWNAIPTPARKFITITDETDVETIDVKGATVRFTGEVKKYTESEIIQKLKQKGASEVQSVSNTSEYEESPTIFTSFEPAEAFGIWLEAQDTVSKDMKTYSQDLLKEILS